VLLQLARERVARLHARGARVEPLVRERFAHELGVEILIFEVKNSQQHGAALVPLADERS
jgi:hypothetical protein